MGARLLYRLSQSAAQVRRGVLESRQLGFRGSAIRELSQGGWGIRLPQPPNATHVAMLLFSAGFW